MTDPATALSVVIPTLDESGRLAGCLAGISELREAGAEVIVCDGGSGDGTVELARRLGATVHAATRGRAAQMNAGAAAARGALLAFLHADTTPSPAARARLLALARCPGTEVWGRFDVRLSGPGAPFRIIEACMNLRSRLTGIATGDQLMFVSRDLFRRVGGFPDIALMEDVALSARLRRHRAPLCLREPVETSSRRWRRDGVLRTVVLMWRLRLAFALGADPCRLARLYHGS